MRRSRARYAIKYAAHLNTIAKHDEMVRCSVGSGLMGNSKVAPTAMAPAEPWAETILADNSSSGKFADCLGPPPCELGPYPGTILERECDMQIKVGFLTVFGALFNAPGILHSRHAPPQELSAAWSSLAFDSSAKPTRKPTSTSPDCRERLRLATYRARGWRYRFFGGLEALTGSPRTVANGIGRERIRRRTAHSVNLACAAFGSPILPSRFIYIM